MLVSKIFFLISFSRRKMLKISGQDIQEFLYLNNKPNKSPPKETKSFYDQRLENKLNFEKEQLEIEFDEKKKFEEQLVDLFIQSC
jgi:hypothetical protein